MLRCAGDGVGGSPVTAGGAHLRRSLGEVGRSRDIWSWVEDQPGLGFESTETVDYTLGKRVLSPGSVSRGSGGPCPELFRGPLMIWGGWLHVSRSSGTSAQEQSPPCEGQSFVRSSSVMMAWAPAGSRDSSRSPRTLHLCSMYLGQREHQQHTC